MVAYVPPPGLRKRGEKDPNKPKRARSAYLCFCDANRGTITKKNPELRAPDVTRLLGQEWNKIKASPAKVEKYVKLAEADKARRQQELDALSTQASEEVSDVEDGDVEQPEETPGFVLFKATLTKKLRKEKPDITEEQLTQGVGLGWKKTSKTKRAEFETKAAGKGNKRTAKK